MKLKWTLIPAAVILSTLLFADTTSDYDHAINFAGYHTYSWISVNVQEPLWTDRVTKAIDEELAQKGWRKVPTGGDAAISAVGSTHIEQTMQTWYDGGFGGGWGRRGWWGGNGGGFPTLRVDRTKVGTLLIDIFDGQTKNVIWHGECTDSLSTNPEKNEKKLEKAVESVFKKFPPETKAKE